MANPFLIGIPGSCGRTAPETKDPPAEQAVHGAAKPRRLEDLGSHRAAERLPSIGRGSREHGCVRTPIN